MNWIFLIPAVAIAFGCMVGAVTVWSDNRRKEREEYYRHETYQKMLDGSAESAETVRQMIREEESRRDVKEAEKQAMGLKMGGLITTVAGVGAGVFLYFLIPDETIFLAGLIPLLVGLVLFFYGSLAASRQKGADAG